MKLSDLEPRFLQIVDERHNQFVERIEQADGVMFLCPKCFNGSPVGVHYVICWRPHVGQEHPPTPGRWEFRGTGMENLSLVAGSSSVLLTAGCRAHFYVRQGEIEMC
jgi:hypothetical protein